MSAKVHAGVTAIVGGIVGHRSGARRSIMTAMRMNEMRRRSDVTASDSARADARQLRRLGYLETWPGYGPAVTEALAVAMALTEDPATSVAMGGRIKNSVRYMVDPIERVPAIRALLTPPLTDIVRAWYGTEFSVSSVRMWRIGHVPVDDQHKNHFGNQWHVDEHPVDTLKLFVQVTPDVVLDESALRFVHRSDTRRALRTGYVDRAHVYPPARRLLEQRVRLFDGPPGSALFLDTDRCLHRAGLPRPGATRGMVQFIFRPAGAAPRDGDYLNDVPHDVNVHEGAIA